MSSKMIQSKLKHESLVFNNIHGFGNTRGLIKDDSKRFVKFNNSIIELNISELIFIPYNIDSFIYYNNIQHKVIEVLLNNINNISYKITDVESQHLCKIIEITDKKISNKLKKTKELTVSISLPTDTSSYSFNEPKHKHANLLAQIYNKMIVQLNKSSRFIFKPVSISLINKLITQYKISFNQIDKIIQTLKKTEDYSLEINNIIINPFNFIRHDIQILTFEKASKICNDYELDIPFDEKCCKFIFDLFKKTNTFYIETGLLFWHLKKLCISYSKNPYDYINTVKTITVTKKINKLNYITTSFLIDLEKSMTDSVMNLFYEKEYDINEEDILLAIQQFEFIEHITMTQEQIKAIKNSIINKFNIILGFPGTGKSTIVKCILFIFSSFYKKHREIIQGEDIDGGFKSESEYCTEGKYPCSKNTSILGPTGLAYVGLASKCGNNHFNTAISGTIHRIIYNQFPKIIQGSSEGEVDRELIDIIPELIIIDEFSMVDSFMFNDILEICLYFGCRLIILGDENQLPSIGPGMILESLITSKIFIECNLTEIKRNSGILMNNIKKMATDILTIEDFTDDSMIFMDIDTFLDDENKLEFYKIKELIDNNQINQHNCKFLSYFKNEKYECNVVNLNNILQSIFNTDGNCIPSKSKFADKFQFRIDDTIIRIENDYKGSDLRANGEIATIQRIQNGIVVIKYIEDNKEINTDIVTLYDEFILSYALTVHKSQGSQYDIIVIFIDKEQNIWEKKALYTAISRAKLRCIIIGKMEDFSKIQRNISTDKVSVFMKESDVYEI